MTIGSLCFFNSCPDWGGGEKWHFETASRLLRRGHRVLLVTHRRGALYERAASSSLRHRALGVSNLSFLNPFKILRIARLLRRERVETIVLNLPSDLKAAGIAARFAGVERIVYRRGSAIPIRNTWLNRFLLNRCVDLVLANSEATKRSVLERNPQLIPAEKIAVLHNAIDLEDFDARPSSQVYPSKGNRIVLGSMGRLSAEKNHHFLIEVSWQLKERNLPFQLLIAGSGPLSAELADRIRTLDLGEEVRLLGFVDDIRGFMASLDIFLLSSLWEGFGYVLIEAMAARKPVIAFDSSAEPEIVVDGETGWLVPAGDLDSFIDRIDSFHRDREQIGLFGERGRHRVEEHFDVEAQCDRLEALLRPIKT